MYKNIILVVTVSTLIFVLFEIREKKLLQECQSTSLSIMTSDPPCLSVPETRDQQYIYSVQGGDQAMSLNHPYLQRESVVFDVGGGDFGGLINQKYHPRLFILEHVSKYNDIMLEPFKNQANVNVLQQYTTDEHWETDIRSIETIIAEQKLDLVDLLNVDCEGCEWDVLEGLIGKNLQTRMNRIQIQFHPGMLVDGTSRRCKIRQLLKVTHNLVYNFDWIRELWQLK